jgi:hypothetical protein
MQFMEPTRAMATVNAESEEDAVNQLRKELEGQVHNLTFEEIKLVAEFEDGETVPTEALEQDHSAADRVLN